jgi:alpha-1,2-mannosyltransferase
MRDFISKEGWLTIRKLWLWAAIGAAGLVIHAGTALLRLSTFFPTPKLLDFAGFYASAWAIRQGLSPYNLPPDWLQNLQAAQAIPLTPPPIYNPPFWPWLLQPLTWFGFPVAAFIWLALNLALLVWITITLADMAGYHRLPVRVLLFFLVLTFGPVFLDLTLGQTSVVLLVTVLAIGLSLARRTSGETGIPSSRLGKDGAAYPSSVRRAWTSGRRSASALTVALAGALAVGVKLFPVTWLAALPFLRRWRELILVALLVVAIFALGFVISPGASRDYGRYLLTKRLATVSQEASVDDQTLVAWLDRLVRPQTLTVSGFGVQERTTVVWSPPWTVDAGVVRWAGYLLLVVLLLPCLFLLVRVAPEHQGAVFYLWVLYGVVALLHIERYNHVLLLPAMAWLWGRTAPRRRGCGEWQRRAVVVAYALVGLSRLTHLWTMLLPAPWGPLASGFGLYAVFLLGAAIVVNVWPSNWVNPVQNAARSSEREVE